MDNLSDAQLYALVINRDLNQDLKEKAIAEFEMRNFSQQYILELDIQYKKIMPSLNTALPIWVKARIIVFPFIVPLQAILANRCISQGNLRRWKQYWRYLEIGWLVWTIFILLAINLFYKRIKG